MFRRRGRDRSGCEIGRDQFCGGIRIDQTVAEQDVVSAVAEVVRGAENRASHVVRIGTRRERPQQRGDAADVRRRHRRAVQELVVVRPHADGHLPACLLQERETVVLPQPDHHRPRAVHILGPRHAVHRVGAVEPEQRPLARVARVVVVDDRR